MKVVVKIPGDPKSWRTPHQMPLKKRGPGGKMVFSGRSIPKYPTPMLIAKAAYRAAFFQHREEIAKLQKQDSEGRIHITLYCSFPRKRVVDLGNVEKLVYDALGDAMAWDGLRPTKGKGQDDWGFISKGQHYTDRTGAREGHIQVTIEPYEEGEFEGVL